MITDWIDWFGSKFQLSCSKIIFSRTETMFYSLCPLWCLAQFHYKARLQYMFNLIEYSLPWVVKSSFFLESITTWILFKTEHAIKWIWINLFSDSFELAYSRQFFQHIKLFPISGQMNHLHTLDFLFLWCSLHWTISPSFPLSFPT